MEPDTKDSQTASEDAVHQAKIAAQALEDARRAQLAEAVELTVAETNRQTKNTLIDALKEVFGDSDSATPGQMKVLIHRVPILCVRIDAMDKNIEEMKDNQKWAVRVVVGLFIAALAKMVFLP